MFCTNLNICDSYTNVLRMSSMIISPRDAWHTCDRRRIRSTCWPWTPSGSETSSLDTSPTDLSLLSSTATIGIARLPGGGGGTHLYRVAMVFFQIQRNIFTYSWRLWSFQTFKHKIFVEIYRNMIACCENDVSFLLLRERL